MPEPRSTPIRLPTGTQRLRWGELYGSSPAYFLAEAASRSAPARHRHGQRPRGGPAARGTSLFRRGAHRYLVVPGPGNPALRSFLAAPGHRLRAAAHARRAAGTRARNRRHDRGRPARPAPASRVHRGSRLHACGRRAHRPSAAAQAAGGCGLCAGHPGPEPRRVRGAWFGRGPVPGRRAAAVSPRPVRRPDRIGPAVRSVRPAFRGAARSRAAPAGARDSRRRPTPSPGFAAGGASDSKAIRSSAAVYRAVTAGQMPAGIEAWLPLFFGRTPGLCDYLPRRQRDRRFRGPRAIARAATAARSKHGTRNAGMTANGPCCPRQSLSCRPARRSPPSDGIPASM